MDGTQQAVSSSISNLKILLVDELMSARKVITSLLQRLGCENITEASSGEEAISNCKNNWFDLIVTDNDLKDMRGLDLLKELKLQASIAEKSFILMSADVKEEMIHEARKEGIRHCLAKPFNVDVLSNKISEALKDSNGSQSQPYLKT